MANYTDWRDWANMMASRPGEVRKAIAAATREATDVLHVESKDIINRYIYAIPEDRYGYSYKRTKEDDKETGYKGYATDDAGKRIKQRRKVDSHGTKAGKKKWTRTGNLRRNEKRRIASATEGVVENAAPYALPRHDLGYKKGEVYAIRGSKRKTTRKAPFRKLAILKTEKRRFDIYRKHILGVLHPR